MAPALAVFMLPINTYGILLCNREELPPKSLTSHTLLTQNKFYNFIFGLLVSNVIQKQHSLVKLETELSQDIKSKTYSAQHPKNYDVARHKMDFALTLPLKLLIFIKSEQ